MFRALALIALITIVSAEDASIDFEEFHATMKSVLASLDTAFVEKIQQAGQNVNLSRNQKNGLIADAIKSLPVEQQENAKKFHEYLIKKDTEMIVRGKSMICEFSIEAQAILNKILEAYENGADVPTKTLFKQLHTIFEDASDDVKAELNKNSAFAKVNIFADALNPSYQAEKLIH